MRQILAIAWKDALLRFSGRSELLFFIVLPIVFTMLIGGATSGSGDSRLPVLVVDEDQGELAAELTQALQRSTAIRPVLRDRAAAEADFAGDDFPALVVIPAGFSTVLRAGTPVALELRTLPDSVNALAARQAIQAAADAVARASLAAAGSVAQAERLRPFATEAERTAYFEDALARARAAFDAAPARLSVTQPVNAAALAADDAGAQASAGQLITWVLIPLLATSALFAYERNGGTLRRLLTTPAGKGTYLLGVIAGQLGLALVQMLLLVGFGAVVLRLNWGSSPAGLALLLVTFGLAATALGTTLGTFIKTEGQASGLSIMLGMTLALLGGCWYPSEFFPEVAQTAARLLPTTWAMQGLTDLVIRGQDIAAVLPEAAVLLGFAAVFFTTGVARFRYE
jgi:ABC-2 type transport system permease protein